MTADGATWVEALPGFRTRLVRRARRLGVDADVAEDLAQETLYEAWRLRDRLYDPAGVDRWLFAILGNVHRRWATRHGREAAHVDRGTDSVTALGGDGSSGVENALCLPDTSVDIEVELERRELVELLDRALAVLPADTRDVLVRRFVHETPVGELAARLGLSEGAVQMRVQRGKLALHRVLTTDLADDAVSYGLIDEADAGWQQTPIWCPACGADKVWGRFSGPLRQIQLYCRRCIEWNTMQSETALYGVTGFRATLTKVHADVYTYWCDGLPGVAAHEHRLSLSRSVLPWDVHHVEAMCPDCGIRMTAALDGIALSTPDGRGFWRDHPRIRRVAYQNIEAGGVPAVLTSYASVTDGARLDVVLTRDTFHLVRSTRT